MSLDITTAAAILKRTYPDGVVDIDYSQSKTLALLKKRKGALVKGPFGASFDVPVKHGNPEAGSATYATGYAQAASENTRYKSWQVTPATAFQFARVNGDIVRRGEGAGSFVDALTSEIENAKDAIRRSLEISLFRAGFGKRGKFSSAAVMTSATGVLLDRRTDVRFVEIGQSIVASATESTAVLRSASALKVVARNVSAGTLDFSAAPSTLGWVAGDTFFRDGDRQNSATPSRLLPAGYAAWVPQTAPTAGDSFFGVDRTVDNRLGGLRQDATASGSVEEALLDACSLVGSEGGMTTHIVMAPDTYNKLVKSMQNRIQYVEMKTEYGFGIPGVRIQGGSGDPIVYSDPASDEGVAFLYNLDEVELRYAGKDLLYLEEQDGLMFRRVAGVDEWLSELVSACNLIVPAPGHAAIVFNL